MAEKTAERLKYEATQRNQATMRQVETLLEQEAIAVLNTAAGFDRQSMGAFLRLVVPQLVDKYGNVNAVAAMRYYDEQRLAWQQRNTESLSRDATRGRAQRYAAARTQSALYVARMPQFNAAELADPIIGYSMARYSTDGFGALTDQMTSAMTRAVASYNRDTILYNAGLDEAVYKVQRVAEPNACAFCALMAFSSEVSASGDKLGVRTADYAINFHDRCRCSIETLYLGDKPIRPDYYDKFEESYLNATRSVGATDATDVLAEMRVNSGRN